MAHGNGRCDVDHTLVSMNWSGSSRASAFGFRSSYLAPARGAFVSPLFIFCLRNHRGNWHSIPGGIYGNKR